MSGILAAARARALCALVVFMFAGCATQSTTVKGALDPVRLLNAIVADDAGYVRDAVSSGTVGVNQRIPAPSYGAGTPLITIAAMSASLNVLRYLISAGADVNARTPYVETALMLAAYFRDESAPGGPSVQRHDAAVRLLVAAGAVLENEPHHYTALAYAAYQGREGTVRFLLERGARVDDDAQDGQVYVNTPLMMATMMGHTNLAVALLKAGANPRIRVKDGMTAREFAVKYEHVNLARALACAETLPSGAAFAGRCQ